MITFEAAVPYICRTKHVHTFALHRRNFRYGNISKFTVQRLNLTLCTVHYRTLPFKWQPCPALAPGSKGEYAYSTYLKDPWALFFAHGFFPFFSCLLAAPSVANVHCMPVISIPLISIHFYGPDLFPIDFNAFDDRLPA